MTENEAIKITGNNATEKEINLKTLYQLVEKFNRGHWGDIQLFEDEENRYSTVIEKVIEEIQQYRAIGTVEELQDMKNKYQEAVVDWRQYRKIGTIEEFKALKEKSVAKKAEVNEFDYGEGYVCGECESFLHYVDDDDEHIRTNYCCHCGTKIDWQ